MLFNIDAFICILCVPCYQGPDIIKHYVQLRNPICPHPTIESIKSRMKGIKPKGRLPNKNVGSNMSFFFQKGGGVSTKPKVLRHFLFALKQSKANKCQCAKRLKTVKKNFFEIFVK